MEKANMAKTFSKALAAFLATAIMLGVYPAYAQAGPAVPTVTVWNDFVKYTVAKANGGFNIRTVEGSPLRKTDQDKRLLYEDEIFESSYATLRIDGQDYIFGNKYGFLGLSGGTVATEVSGARTTSTWAVEGIEVNQIIELIGDISSPNAGNVIIRYEVSNTGTTRADVGIRLLLDTMVDQSDGTGYALGLDETVITRETRLSGADVPQFWRTGDNMFAPKTLAYGFLSGWNNDAPDEMVLGHWNGLFADKWEYSVDPNLDFTNRFNKYGTADSAVALYWDPEGIAPGETRVFETYYGIGNLAAELAGAPFNVNVICPAKMELNAQRNGYENAEFDLLAEVDNSLENSSVLTNLTATLESEDGLFEILPPPDPSDPANARYVPHVLQLGRNGRHTFAWRVRVLPQAAYSLKKYRVSMQADANAEAISVTGYILLPGAGGAPPQVQFNSISPENLYFEGEKYLSIKGKGFDLYREKGNWDMYLQDILGTKTRIHDDGITLVDDTQIAVRIDGTFALGPYTIFIDYHADQTLGLTETLPGFINMSSDERFRGNYYGVLAVTLYEDGGAPRYKTESFRTEDEFEDFAAGTADEILLELRGNLVEITQGGMTYYIGNTEDNPVTINKIIEYRGEPLVVKKEGSHLTVSGDGDLKVVGGLTFWKWEWLIDLLDGERFSLAEGEKDIKIQFTGLGYVLQTVGGFLMDIQMGILQKTADKAGKEFYAISFGGKLALTFLPNKKIGATSGDDGGGAGGAGTGSGGSGGGSGGSGDSEVDTEDDRNRKIGGFSCDIDQVLFGEREGEGPGFIGIDTTVSVSLPNEMLGGVVSNGFAASLTINTIKRIYSLEFAASIKIVECEGLLTIRMTEDNVPVPDAVEFTAGGTPGVPIVPGILYLSRMGGGYSRLYETLMGEYSIPPLTLHLNAGLNLAGVLEGSADFEISMRYFSMNAELEIAKIPCIKEVYAMAQWVDPVFFEMSGTINLLDIIRGSAGLYLSSDYFEGWARVLITVPDWVPLAGGFVLAGVEIGISSVKVWGAIEIIGIGFGVAYYWEDGNVEFTKGVDSGMVAIGPGGVSSAPKGLFARDMVDDSGRPFKMVFATNARVLATEGLVFASSSTAGILAGQPFILAWLEKTEHTIHIVGDEHALLQVEYTGDAGDLNLKLYRPGGDEYELIPSDGAGGGNYLVQEIPPQTSASGDWEKYVFISIPDPEQGNWKLKSDAPVSVTLIGVEPLPKLQSVSVIRADERQVMVAWSAENTDGASVSVHLTRRLSDESTGIPVATAVDASIGNLTFTTPDDLPSGYYYVRVSMAKGDSYFETMTHDEMFYFRCEDEPLPPAEITLTPVGDGQFRVDIVGEEDDVEGYYVEFYDKEGLTDFGQFLVPKGDPAALGGVSTATLGGSFTMDLPDGSAVTRTLAPGREYRAGAATLRVKHDGSGDKYFHSPVIFSDKAFLPTPEPANTSVTYGAGFVDAVPGSGSPGSGPAKMANAPTVTLHFRSDQDVTTVVRVDHVEGAKREGRSWSIGIPVEDGDHTVEFVSVNDRGDTSKQAVSFRVDATPPQLMIEHPVQGEVSENGRVRLKGITDGDATLLVNGVKMPTAPDGTFDTTIGIASTKFIHEFTVEASDKAGNTTTYDVVVVNDRVKPIAGVRIDAGDRKMPVGQTKRLALIGTDTAGQEYELASSQVNWSIMEGGRAASITPTGRLTTREEGEVVVLASFSIAEDYAFEDAVVIAIESSSPPPEEWDEPSRWDLISEELENLLLGIIAREQGLRLIAMADVGDFSSEIRIAPGVTLTISGGALSGQDKLLVAVVADPSRYRQAAENQGAALVSDVYELRFARNTGAVAQPMTLVMTYDPEVVAHPEALGVYVFNETLGKWQYVGGVLDPANHTVTVTLPHLSRYALLDNPGLKRMEDIAGRWSEPYIAGLVSLGVVEGVPKDGLLYFEPERSITRLEFTKMMVASLPPSSTVVPDGSGSPTAEDPATPGGALPFVDEPLIPVWGRMYAEVAYSRGLVKGSPTESGLMLNPRSSITRAEAATIAGRALEQTLLHRNGHAVSGAATQKFIDAPLIPDWAGPYVEVLTAYGILSGYPDSTFRPNNPITREEAAKVLSVWLSVLEVSGWPIPRQ